MVTDVPPRTVRRRPGSRTVLAVAAAASALLLAATAAPAQALSPERAPAQAKESDGDKTVLTALLTP